MPISSKAVIHQKTVNRPVDDDTPTIGQGPDAAAELGGDSFQKNLHLTMKHGMAKNTVRRFRNRITHIAVYWQKECPRYFAQGVRKITDAEKADPQMFFHRNDKFDLVYAGLNVDFVLKFLVQREKKADGNFRTFDDMRKYKDAINYGASVRNEFPSSHFFQTLGKYLASYQKKTTSAKKEGKVETKEADPITVELYCIVNQWAFEEGNILILFWTLTQWNCMARCGSIDPLGFRNFRIAADAHSVTYDSTKMDKEGKKCFSKHIYSNNEKWFMCQWTGMGLFCMVYAEELGHTDKFFTWANNNEGTAAKKYQEQLQALVNRNQERRDIVLLHCRKGHFNPYSMRKGGASYATSGTTLPPNLTSIAHRGDWSMGSVFDIYWRFLPEGDHYLGQIMSGKNPNLPSFKALPPHWKLANPMNNPDIKNAMDSNFGPILKAHAGEDYDPTGLLLRCLACVVHHSDSLLHVLDSGSLLDHPLTTVPLFGVQSNLPMLKNLVTTDPTPGIMTTATGIPPHVETACQLEEIRQSLSLMVTQTRAFAEELRKRDAELKDTIVKAVKEAVEDNDIRAGNITDSRMATLLQGQRKNIAEDIERGINGILAKIPGGAHNQQPQQQNQGQDTENVGLLSGKTNTWQYVDRPGEEKIWWGVPKNFKFPRKLRLERALRSWLLGHRVSDTEAIRPFRLLRSKKSEKQSLLPFNIRGIFNAQWSVLFRFVEKGGLLDGLPRKTATFTPAQMEQTKAKMWAILKERASYVFLDQGPSSRKDRPENLSLATWANRVTLSEIKKNGTDQDKSYLDREPQTRAFFPRPNRQPKQVPLYLQRQERNNQLHSRGNQNRNPRLLTGLSALQEQIARDQAQDEAEGRPAAKGTFMHRDNETPPAHVAWLTETFGNKLHGYKQCPIVDGREQPRCGKCAVAVCKWPQIPLEGRMTHRCDACGLPIHQPCCQDARLTYEDDGSDVRNFCCEQCMVRFRNLDDQVQ